MSLEELLKIVPPPEEPIEASTEAEWARVQSRLGIVLPPDYKRYINQYGSGRIGAFLLVLNPFSASHYLNLFQASVDWIGELRQLKSKWGEIECPYPLYPQSGGLLPWGYTENGNRLYWRTVGEAENWPIVVNEARGPQFEEFDHTMHGFLVKLLTGMLQSHLLPTDFTDDARSFASILPT